MINSKIADGTGRGFKAEVTEDKAVRVQPQQLPSKSELSQFTIYRDFARNSAGSNDMRVDGSTTPVEFTISADPNFDVYVKRISFVISDAAATLATFGTLAALTNGCDISYENDAGVVVIAEELKSNFDFVRLCSGKPAFGDGQSAFRASNVVSTSEAFLPVLDLAETFGPQFGIRLRAGSNDKIKITINDNVSAIDRFDAIAYGIKRL